MKQFFLEKPIFFEHLALNGQKRPQKRYTDLVEQVFQRHHLSLDEKTLCTGSQLSFMEICKTYLKREDFKPESEFVVFTIASTEFDPETPGFGPHFQSFFGEMDIYNVCYQGYNSTFTAINLGKCLLKKNPKYRIGHIIGIEQNTNFLPLGYTGPTPTQCSLGKVQIQSRKKSRWELVASGVAHPNCMESTIKVLLQEKSLSRKNLQVVTKMSLPTKHLIDSLIKNFECIDLAFADSVNGILEALASAHFLSGSSQDVLFLMEDKFSSNVGYLLVNSNDKSRHDG